MWFNVFLVIFLIISFLTVFGGIGNCLIRLKALGTCMDNLHEVQKQMTELMRVTAEYDNKQLLLIEEMAKRIDDIAKHARMITREEERFDILENNINSATDELRHAISEYNKIIAETYTKTTADISPKPSKPVTPDQVTTNKTARKSAKKVAK